MVVGMRPTNPVASPVAVLSARSGRPSRPSRRALGLALGLVLAAQLWLVAPANVRGVLAARGVLTGGLGAAPGRGLANDPDVYLWAVQQIGQGNLSDAARAQAGLGAGRWSTLLQAQLG